MSQILQGDSLEVLKSLPDQSVHCCITSPPYYGLRDYGVIGQIGLEDSLNGYISKLNEVFHEVRRVLRDDGTLWLNLGDSYSNGGRKTRDTDDKLQSRKMDSRPNDGYKPKDLLGVPWRVAFALQADGWYLRSDIIWHKINGMPQSVKDRPVSAHEHVFLFAKTEDYYYDWEAIATSPSEKTIADKRPKGVLRQRVNLHSKYHDCDKKCSKQFRKQDQIGRSDYTGFNDRYTPVDKVRRRDVWSLTNEACEIPHFAVMNSKVVNLCLLAGCPENGIVLDPFFGAGTTGLVALKNNRQFIGIELNTDYIKLAETRISPWLHQSHLTSFEREVTA